MTEIVRFLKLEDVADEIDLLYGILERRFARLMPFGDIEHIGSTSIPGSITKGDLDISVRVPASRFEDALSLLDTCCERHEESHNTEEYQPYLCHIENQQVGIQLFISGSVYEKRFLFWRDALSNNPRLLEQYNDLKVAYHGRSMSEYRDAKSKFIRTHL